MLEQEFNNQESNNLHHQPVSPAATQVLPQPEKDLFRNYEITSWNFSPRVYKIIAASAIFNVLTLFVLAQSNLLTTKGCESPIVGRVCQALDTIYVSSILLGTDAEFASRDYEKTSLEDAEITYIDVSGQTPPLEYPEGYFAIADPEGYALKQQQLQMQMQNGDMSGFVMPPTGSIATTIPNTSGDLLNTPQNLPPPTDNAIIGNLPNSPLGNTPPPVNPPMRNRKFPPYKMPKPTRMPPMPKMNDESPKTLPDFGKETAKTETKKPETPEKEEPKEESKQIDLASLPVAGEVINKKPFQDLGAEVLDKLAANKVDLTKSFTFVMQTGITKDAKFDKNTARVLKREGDKEMLEVAQTAIEAIGDSGILVYLKQLNVEKINFTLVQDDKQIYAIITSDQPSEQKAKTVSSGFNAMLSIGKSTVKEEDTLALLNAATVESKGKNFVLNFKLDKPIAQGLIKRVLDKEQAKRQQEQQPNGTAITKPNQNSGK